MGQAGSCCGEPQKAGKAHRHSPPSSESEDSNDDDVVDDLPQPSTNYITRKGRQSVSAEAYGEWNKKGDFKAPVHPKTDEQKERIRATLAKSFLFSALEEDDLKTVIDAFREKRVPASITIIHQGDDGDCLYLLEEGDCDVFKLFPGEQEPKHVFTQRPGDAFGELALLYNCPRAATVKAHDDAVLWQLDRNSFNHIVKDAAARKREMYENFLKDVELLKDMDPYERSKLADALKAQKFNSGDLVIQQGDSGDTFYMLEDGTAEAIKDDNVVMRYKRGDYFGELALMRDQPRAASVKATSPLKVVSLDRRSFKRLLGPVESILSRNAGRYEMVKRQLSAVRR